MVREKYTGTPPPTNGLISLDRSGRLTVYQAPASSRTFYFTAGDVGYMPMPNAHYLGNTDNIPPVFLEVLQAPTFSDVSVGQWLGLTAPQIVKDHLNVRRCLCQQTT